MLRTTPSLDTNTSRLVGGPSGVQQQLTPMTPGKKGTSQPAPLGAVVGEHWRARSVPGTLPDGQKTGLWRTFKPSVTDTDWIYLSCLRPRDEGTRLSKR